MVFVSGPVSVVSDSLRSRRLPAGRFKFGQVSQGAIELSFQVLDAQKALGEGQGQQAGQQGQLGQQPGQGQGNQGGQGNQAGPGNQSGQSGQGGQVSQGDAGNRRSRLIRLEIGPGLARALTAR